MISLDAFAFRLYFFMRKLEYKVGDEFNNIKISSFLIGQNYSQQNLKRLRQEEGCIILNDEIVHMNHTLQSGDNLLIIVPVDEASDNIVPISMPIDILYEDEDMLVINKSADMPIHPSLNNYDNTLANGVAYYMSDKLPEGEEFVYRCINRLDRDTSGITIIAKHMISASILYKQMKNREISRYYYALVEGHFDKQDGIIDKPIARMGDSIINRCVDEIRGERAVTCYEVIREGFAADEPISLVRCHLETGRTHQIRVHLSYIGHPLIGDGLYNPDSDIMNRQALHAREIDLIHPITNERMKFVAEYPEDMIDIMNNMQYVNNL